MSKHKNLIMKAGWISIVGNILLFSIKLWAGIVTGSVALLADAWHTLSDSASSVVVIVSAWFSRKPADSEHPFGHGRIELISSVIISVMLAFVAFDFLQSSIEKLVSRETVHFGTLAFVALILSVVVKEAMAQYAMWASKKIDSPMLKTDAWHHRSDALSSVIILAGVLLANKFWWIDGALGIFVSLFILHTTVTLFRENINPLLGEQPDKEMVATINRICNNRFYMETSAHHFHLHRYGEHKEMTFHIRMPGSMDLDKVHQVATDIENDIKKELNIDSTIHVEPLKEKVTVK